jgi:hypothetical protein
MIRLSDHSTASGRASRRAGVVTALVATLALVGCMPASASNVHIQHTLFGMHDNTATASFGEIHEGAVRLWDVGVQWQQIETHVGGHKYDWSRLDDLVTAAHVAHAEVTMVVAMTPHFYSNDPRNLPPKRIPAYKDFVRALMKRYKSFHGFRGIDAYEVWNESNIRTFWTGSVGTMARLTKAMHDVRNKVDKRAKVIGPAMVTRLDYQLEGLAKYFGQRVGGKPVWRYMDAIALSLYPLPKYGSRIGVPEDAIKQLHRAKRVLHKRRVPGSKNIWNTEVNYGLQSGSRGGTKATPISDARQASNVVRTYLLNAANGVKRVFWYRYDWGRIPGGGTLGNTLLTDPDDSSTVTAAGRAYARAQQWMHGTLLGGSKHPPCQKNRHGTYTCVVKDSSGKRYIYWNPFHGAKVRLPKGVHHLQGVLGTTSSVAPRSTLKVNYKPVMVH